MKIEFDITPEHMLLGTKEDPSCCPLALAAIDAGFEEPDVQMCVISLTRGNTKYFCSTDTRTRDFLRTYDDSQPQAAWTEGFHVEFHVDEEDMREVW